MKVDASIQFSDSHEGEKKQYNILTRIQTIQKKEASDETKEILSKLESKFNNDYFELSKRLSCSESDIENVMNGKLEKNKLLRLEAEIKALYKHSQMLEMQKEEPLPEQPITNEMSEIERKELESLRRKIKTLRTEFGSLNSKHESLKESLQE